MPDSNTVIAALKYQGGVLMGADSQVSDLVVQVRWPIEKLSQVQQHPLVIGLSGSMGRGDRAREALDATGFRSTTFDKKDRVQGLIEGSLTPVYEGIQKASKPPGAGIHEIALTGLAVFWAEGEPHIFETEFNGDNSFHQSFHAIGSGGSTAYAVYRTLTRWPSLG